MGQNKIIMTLILLYYKVYIVPYVEQLNINLKNIHIHVDLIAGLPYEDLASFKNSFNMVYNLQADAVQLGFLKILSGSLLARQQQEHGYNYLSQPPYEVLSNKYISYAELRMLNILLPSLLQGF